MPNLIQAVIKNNGLHTKYRSDVKYDVHQSCVHIENLCFSEINVFDDSDHKK